MVVCPNMGTEPAAAALANMLRSFPNIKYILVVGIAGGVPCYGPGLQEQICLGDVVVGVPQKENGGVTHYDFGTYEGQGELKAKTHTLHPSAPLLTAVNNLRSSHMGLVQYKIPQFLQQLRMNVGQSWRKDFEDPGSDYDLLFEDNYDHGDPNRPCTDICDRDNRARTRAARGRAAYRETDHPHIHYGTIGSGNAVVKSATKRNELRNKHGIICLEMEAAGIINSYQGLIIRGICDYADSHKNKKWQPYAAAAAAAYAKELLMSLPRSASPPCGEYTNTGPFFGGPSNGWLPNGGPQGRETPLPRYESPMSPPRAEPPLPAPRAQPPVSSPWGGPLMPAPSAQPPMSSPWAGPPVSSPWGGPLMPAPRAEPPMLSHRGRESASPISYSHSHERNHSLNLGPAGVNVGWCGPGNSRHASSNSYDTNVGVNLGPVGLNLGWCGPGGHGSANSHSHDNSLIGLNLGPVGHLNLGMSGPGGYSKGGEPRGLDTAVQDAVLGVTNAAANLLFLPFGGARHY